MKDTHGLLVKLRAAGVEPVPDHAIAKAARIVIDLLTRGLADPDQPAIRRLVNLLEARATLADASAKLAEVREWAEAEVAKDPPPRDVQAIGRANAARDLLVWLDREPKP